jgi:type IX secretion system substrate protein
LEVLYVIALCRRYQGTVGSFILVAEKHSFMKLSAIFPRSFFLFLLIAANVSVCHAQKILAYDSLQNGGISMVATNATADDSLKRVNGAAKLSPPCTHGFSSKKFDSGIVYVDTLPAVEIWVAPNSGYLLKIDSFNADLRHSTTGPANVRFAYSTDSLTWTDQGVDLHPFASATCDSMDTCTWKTSFNVIYPKKMWFRIYGFNCNTSAGSGNLQIMDLFIDGSVKPISSLLVPEENGDAGSFQVYPNPVERNVSLSYHLSKAEKVNISIYNVVGQEIAPIVDNSVQQPGDYNYAVPVIASGVYFVKLSVGNTTFTRKIVKL